MKRSCIDRLDPVLLTINSIVRYIVKQPTPLHPSFFMYSSFLNSTAVPFSSIPPPDLMFLGNMYPLSHTSKLQIPVVSSDMAQE